MRRQLPSTQALQCFEAAARHQSFTRATQELALTQGAVSRQVAALEGMVGVSLSRRTRHGMTLTPAGVDYARHVGQRLDALERPFLFAYAQVDAALFAGTPEQLRQWAGTRALLLLPEEVVPVCKPSLRKGGRPFTPKALAALPLLQQATRPEAWRQWFDAHGVEAAHAMAGPRYELFSLQLAVAQCGLGAALVPTLLVQQGLRAGTLAVACDRPLHGQGNYYLVQPAGEERPAPAALREWLQAEAQRAELSYQ
jgi:DNA-binding transcriptional LysR family regulator